MALTEDEKERARYHLGYPGTSSAASLSFGSPIPLQTLFLVDSALTRLRSEREENRIRRYLNILDGVEEKLVEAQDRLAATQLEDLYLRQDEPEKLEREYQRWAGRLADILMVPLYAYSTRFSRGAGGAGNVPVRNG